MDNNYNQQPQYQAPQQPQYQQPQYQAPQYQQPMYQPRPQGAGIAGLVDTIIKFAPIAIVVFLSLAAVGFLYYFISGIVNASNYDFNADIFFSGIATGLGVAAKYVFYSLVTAFAAKFLKK